MKSWITRLRTSAALDADQPPAARLRRWPDASAELCGIEEEMVALDRALKETAPRAEAPASLHGSIMQVVRAANRPAAVPRQPNVLRWVPVPVFAAMVLLLVLWVLQSPVRTPVRNAQPLAAATSALKLGDQMVRSMPSAMVAPLSDELDRLNRDLDKTAQFLLASLP
jgi:hypothetical protein